MQARFCATGINASLAMQTEEQCQACATGLQQR